MNPAKIWRIQGGAEVEHALPETRIPKRCERVLAQGKPGLFAVLKVHHDFNTADLKLIGRTGIVLKRFTAEILSFVSPC